MAYFLAGVADAELFKGSESFATAKTLIDSSITIGVSSEDIRAGKGAKLYGKYFHSSTFDLKLSDAMFKLEYLAANVGSEIELGGDAMKVEEITSEKKTVGAKNYVVLNLSDAPVPVNAGCGNAYVYYKLPTDSYYKSIEATSKEVVLKELGADETFVAEKYCVKYFYTNDAARKVTINANFIPDTLSIYLTANLYAGDVANCNSASTTKVGTLTIKVPRFLLSGSQEIAMSMTGAANTPLEGSALATKGDNCDGDGIYAQIIEVIDNRVLSDIILAVEGGSDMEVTVPAEGGNPLEYDLPDLYGRFEDSAPMLIPDADYAITGTLTGGEITNQKTVKVSSTFTEGTVTYTYTKNSETVATTTLKIKKAQA